MARKLVRLNIQETSGVDHPAHLTEGWVVMKSANPTDVTAVLDELRPEEVAVETTVEDLEKSEELVAVEETPEVEVVAETEEAPEVSDEIEVDKATDIEATESATAEEVFTTFVSKEETMSNTSDVTAPEVVIIPEAASEAEIIKAMPAAIRKMLDEATANSEAALRKAAASEQALIAEREGRADEAAVIKAAQWSHLNLDPSIVGPALRRLSETDSTLATEVVKALDSANAVAETNAVFTEVGSDAPVATDDAFSKMENLAKAAVANGTSPSFESAIMSVAQSNPDLYSAYLNEKGR